MTDTKKKAPAKGAATKQSSNSKAVKTVEAAEGKVKDFVILRDSNSPLLRIGYDGGGEVPDDLKGLYTSTAFAEAAIRNYNRGK